MDVDRFFHTIEIFIEILGFAIILVKGGVYFGAANITFKHLSAGQEEIKNTLLAHTNNDERHFQKIQEDINNLKIADIQKLNPDGSRH